MASPQHTTLSSQPTSESVTVTHPHHPLYGQQLTVVRLRQGTNPDLVVRLPDGTHAAIAMHLTDYAGASAPQMMPDSPHLLDLDGLRHVVQLLQAIRQDGRWPKSIHTTALPQATRRSYHPEDGSS
jgi:hypothetical protein